MQESRLSLALHETSRAAEDVSKELRVCTQILWIWLAFRTAFWTLLASTQPNGTFDLMEWLAWGHQWQLGYPKHPPFPAWLAAAFHTLTPGSLTGVYLLSYIAWAFTMWCVWRVARDILTPRLALVSALCLEGYLSTNLQGADFSNNIALCATWMATALSFQQALKTNAPRWWLALGLAVGLSALSKYSIALLLIPLIAFTVAEPRARFIWRRKEPYLAAGLALLIFLPHAAWMQATGFTTIDYTLDRAAGYQHWYDRLVTSASFLADQAARILPVLLIIAPLLLPPRGKTPAAGDYERRFLDFAFLGPILLLLASSLLFGLRLRGICAMPLWSLLGVFVLARAGDPAGEWWRLRRAGLVGATVAAAMAAVFVMSNAWFAAWHGRPFREHFPGELLAKEMTTAYQACYGPAIVAGDAWIANNIACNSRPVPVVYPTVDYDSLYLDEKRAPWTSDADLRARGGILVWNADRDGAELPPPFQERFPSSVPQPALLVPYQGGSHFASAHIGWALVLPAGQ